MFDFRKFTEILGTDSLPECLFKCLHVFFGPDFPLVSVGENKIQRGVKAPGLERFPLAFVQPNAARQRAPIHVEMEPVSYLVADEESA